MTDELKPCPFCGGSAETKIIGNDHTKMRATKIACRPCNVSITVAAIRNPQMWTTETAIKKWNTRADLPATDAQALTNPKVQALVEALAFYGVHALGCRLIHREGDPYRQALHDDGGEKARAALAALEVDE